MLRQNQQNAVNISINNDFISGVHYHATGTGKSWIALEILCKYHYKYPKNNVFWICERKSILTDQFSNKTLKQKGYNDIFKKYHIINFTINKPIDWFKSINISPIWGKPILVIINRAFLTNYNKYQLISVPISLIIHDECHSITNKTTKAFYNYMIEKHKNLGCIGFSATPVLISPFNNILSKFSMYEAVKQGIIVKPSIQWLKNYQKLTQETILYYLKNEIDKLVYSKVIVWCGIIEHCLINAELFSRYFTEYSICVDTSKNIENNNYISYNAYSNIETKAILFCACKHREGSDIKNLDGCIFLDGVSNRNARCFVQCIGRVLRRDSNNNKQYGLIIDMAATSNIQICDRINNFYQTTLDYFPWETSNTDIIINNQNVKISSIQFILKENIELPIKTQDNDNNKIDSLIELDKYFIRQCPDDKKYQKRLKQELSLINKQCLAKYLLHAVKIIEITEDIPHITRGSCGSSLVCYLLGISHIDPVHYNITFSRFLNEFRKNLPDIDFDFPYNQRDDVFLRIEAKWPKKIARISNHVYYHEKSAIREALRRVGIRQFISKSDINNYIKKLPLETRNKIISIKKQLCDQFKCYSLHCGGIIYYPEGIPDDIKLDKNGTIDQIKHNKIDVQKIGNFKIDILSSRGLAQLVEIVGNSNLDLSQGDFDVMTQNLLQSGNNIGITLAESPLIRKAFIKIAPKCISDVAICLSIIRPMASGAKYIDDVASLANEMIYDDDAITLIRKIVGCSEADADRFRRGFAKGDDKIKKELLEKIDNTNDNNIIKLISDLQKLKKYSFCKSHAFSYAQLVWQLAYHKAHNPKKFWKSCLNHSESNYRKWVHYHEARLAGVNIQDLTLRINNKSIYSKARSNNKIINKDSKILFLTGSSNINSTLFYPGCYLFGNSKQYKFRGIIASYKILGYNSKTPTLILFIGVENNKYIEVVYKGKAYINNKHIGAYGNGVLEKKYMVLDCNNITLY